MTKVLIIGQNGFVAKNIFNNLKKYFYIKKLKYLNFLKLNKKDLLKYDYIINCTLSKEYVNQKYLAANDFDLKIAKKIVNTSIKMIFLSSRKVYKSNANIRETSILKPKCFYSKNKLISENKLKKILLKKILILRISNLIGNIDLNKKYRKIHYTFIDSFFINIKKNIIFNNNQIYKDFITVDKFSEILRKLIKINAHGIFNVSIGKKIYLKELVKWLNFHNKQKKIKTTKLPKNFNKDSFFLNNSKLKRIIKIKTSKLELKEYCIKLSKNFFNFNKNLIKLNNK